MFFASCGRLFRMVKLGCFGGQVKMLLLFNFCCSCFFLDDLCGVLEKKTQLWKKKSAMTKVLHMFFVKRIKR